MIVELDRGENRLREIAPGCEVEVLATGPETGPQAAEMPNTDPGRPVSPLLPCYASKSPPAQAGRSVCPVCGASTDPRRPWGRYCSAACRQRAY